MVRRGGRPYFSCVGPELERGPRGGAARRPNQRQPRHSVASDVKIPPRRPTGRPGSCGPGPDRLSGRLGANRICRAPHRESKGSLAEGGSLTVSVGVGLSQTWRWGVGRDRHAGAYM